ncbi:MAG: hypothetical protein PHR36_05535 [Patescibacteria group bacterium]|nr:hypothetical protein [Patescibacteria group bacterium]
MKTAFNFIVLAFFITISVLFVCKLFTLNQKPEPYEVDFSGFGGKIVAEGEVILPKFSQEAPFTEAVGWGPEATLTFGSQEENFCFQIWRPDSSGNGQYARKEYEKIGPWKNVLWRIGKVERQENKFIFLPKRDKGCIFPLLVIFTILFVFSYESWKSFTKGN